MRINPRGLKELKDHLAGKRLSMKQAVLAKCCDCMGEYEDGRVDCNIPACPLYPWMPYKNKTEDRASKRKCYGLNSKSA